MHPPRLRSSARMLMARARHRVESYPSLLAVHRMATRKDLAHSRSSLGSQAPPPALRPVTTANDMRRPIQYATMAAYHVGRRADPRSKPGQGTYIRGHALLLPEVILAVSVQSSQGRPLQFFRCHASESQHWMYFAVVFRMPACQELEVFEHRTISIGHYSRVRW